MKILYFSKFLSPVGGGGDLIFYSLMKRMLELGHEIHVICYDTEVNYNVILPQANIYRIKPVISSGTGKFLSVREHLTYILNAFRKGRSIINKEKIDIIHANILSPVVPATLLGKLYRIPVIITIHDLFRSRSENYWNKWSRQNDVPRYFSVLGNLYERLMVRLPVSRIHAGSLATQQDILNLNPRAKVSLVYYGIELRNNYPRPEYKKCVLFIGRLIITKNLEIVIRSFEKISGVIPDAKLVILGDGPMRENWEALASNLKLNRIIEFKGYVSEEEKLTYLSTCSCLVFPSLHEGFGLVILEAFSMSKPALVSDVPPFDEIIDNEINGFLIRANSIPDWANKIIAILSNTADCQRMGNNARKKVSEGFNSVVMGNNMERLYIELSASGMK
jgi:glycosyltransferase involved in cell wall biosynthesis